MTAIEKVIGTATSEIGYIEKKSNSSLDDKTANAGSGNWTKYARDLDNLGNVYNGKKNGYAWCDIFVDWCFITTFGLEIGMKLLCQPYNGAGAGCTYSAQYYKNKGQFHAKNPQPGDQVFFTNDGGKTSNHTGLVVKVDSSKVYTIEGNTSSAAGVVANGGCVRDKSYSLTYAKIMGYGRPDWSIVLENEEKQKESEGDEMQTYEQWKKYMYRYRKEQAELAAPSWSEKELAEAIAAGITDGTRPQDFPSRVEAAIMALRAAKK